MFGANTSAAVPEAAGRRGRHAGDAAHRPVDVELHTQFLIIGLGANALGLT